MATTLYLWFRMFAVKDQYQSAVCISGLVTFIAAYHYVRIFNSWVGAYEYSTDATDPKLTGVPFNDAYRYMDWLLTVPLLLIEILLVMKLDDKTYSSKAWTLGAGSALMIVLAITESLSSRAISLPVGCAGPFLCASFCTSSMNFWSACRLPRIPKPILKSRAKSKRRK